MEVTIESLITEGSEIRKKVQYKPVSNGGFRTFNVYVLTEERRYNSWVTTAFRYLSHYYKDDVCVGQFQQAMDEFEDKRNHHDPVYLDKMIGILESCKNFNSSMSSATNSLEDAVLEVEKERELYASYEYDYINNIDCIEQYQKWYTKSFVLLERCFDDDNEYFRQFKNVDNTQNGYGLRRNYDGILASYMVLISKLRTGEFVKTEKIIKTEKKPLLFVSHSSKDETFVEHLVNLLQTIGFNKRNLFCSSVEGYGIDEGADIYETLKSKFQDYDIYVIFVLSENYYNSPACLNEMGAAWVLQSDYTTFIIPGFQIINIRGAINANRLAIIIDNPKYIRSTLNKFKDKLIDKFKLTFLDDDIVWEKARNKFIENVSSQKKAHN